MAALVVGYSMRKISSREIIAVAIIILVIVLFFVLNKNIGSSAVAGAYDDENTNPDGGFQVVSPDRGTQAPDFTLMDPDGHPYSLADATKSGPVLIDFWAIWCLPCKMELPIIDSVYSEYKNRGVQFYGVNSDASPERVKQFFSAGGVGFPMLIDKDAAVKNTYNIQEIPTVLVIDKTGVVRAFDVGYDANTKADLSKCLDTLLKE